MNTRAASTYISERREGIFGGQPLRPEDLGGDSADRRRGRTAVLRAARVSWRGFGTARELNFPALHGRYGSEIDAAFVVNLADAPAMSHSRRATLVTLEPGDGIWPDTGVNVQIMQPGQPNCKYHSEPVQEDFLVLHGECIAILDGEERPLRKWDFLHCPAGTEHVFVGAGDGPCAVLMIGSRRLDSAHYPVNDVAAKHDASVDSPTDRPAEAYKEWRTEPRRPAPNPWPL